MTEQSVTQQSNWLCYLQHSCLAFYWLDKRSISWSCQPSFRVLQKSELESDGCRVNHAEERPILLSVPGGIIILGMKTQGQNETVYHQHEYTDYVALILLGEWVFP